MHVANLLCVNCFISYCHHARGKLVGIGVRVSVGVGVGVGYCHHARGKLLLGV
jgi:hypothetical protein